MRKTLLFFLSALIAISCLGANPKPFTVPELRQWQGAEGYFTPSGDMRIVYDAPSLEKVARLLSEDYRKMFSQDLKVVNGKPSKGDIYLTALTENHTGEEGYTLSIGDVVSIRTSSPKGSYWGTRTLLQLFSQRDDMGIPKGTAVDYPDYPFRGLLLDCARKYIPLSYLKDLVKVMSFYKMNCLQVHLNDNGFKQYFDNDWDRTYAAFRLECDTFPGLTARDGYYTKEEFKQFQKEAAAIGVEIIPEIDSPAHSLAFTHYRKDIGSQEWGMDHLDLSNPETIPFIEAVFKEYLSGEDPVFVGPRVNIGTDEYSNERKELREQFRSYTDHFIRYVEGYGKKVCLWGALSHAEGDTPVKSDDVTMGLWNNNYAHPREMVSQGFKLISMTDWSVYIVPGASYYHDYLDIRELYSSWTPARIGDETFAEKDPSVVGGMFALWNDLVGNGISVKDIHHRIFPALQTVSSKTWNTSPSVSFKDFDAQRKNLPEAPGVNVNARIGKGKGLVFERGEVKPSETLPISEIGYGYTVEFTLSGKREDKGTPLFSNGNAVFYLSDPVSGRMAFSRDGYLNTFSFAPYEGETATIKVVGDSVSTALYVNGKLYERLSVGEKYLNGGTLEKNKYFPTLVFPLEKAGNFRSRLTDLKVYNYKKED